MKCRSDKPPENAGRKHRSVSTRVITLYSPASVGGAGIMGLQAGSADMRPLSAGWDVYTGRYHGCHGAPKK